MRKPYSFSVLRYVHDAVTQEFINVGVVVFSPQAGFLRAACTGQYGRITRMFSRIDGARFRQVTNFIQRQVEVLGDKLPLAGVEPGKALEHLLAAILPPDDSSLQFSPAGVGLADDMQETLSDLYERYVDRYAREDESGRRTRTEDDVWKVFSAPLERRHLLERLQPKQITAPSYEYEFDNAWKNEMWHLYQPVSFDLAYPNSIVEKANSWVGRATSLRQSNEQFKLHLLLGEPHDGKLQKAFARAQNILNEMPGQKEFIRENEAEAFAQELEREVREHDSK